MAPRPGDELAIAQEGLARTVGVARAGDDRALAQLLREGGEGIIQMLGGLLKLAQVHAPDNRAFEAPAEAFARGLAGLVQRLGPVHLALVEDQAYVNEVRVRLEGKGAGRELGPALARHNAGGLAFHAALPEAAVRQLTGLLARPPAPTAPRRALQQALRDAGLGTVELSPRFRFGTEAPGAARTPLDAVRRMLQLAEEGADGLALGRALNPLPLRRTVLEVLDVGPGTPALWEALGESTGYPQHAATVALVALLTGQASGLSLSTLQDLGMAALVHDAGYAPLVADARVGSAEDALVRHPAEGARLLLRQRGFHRGKLRRLRAVLDHHRDHAEPRGRPSILGQILRLAEDYATLLRVYAGRIGPHDALAAIAAAAGTTYHPVLARLLVNALGCFPPGTLLELADGRYARSVSPARSPATWAHPLVRVYDPQAKAYAPDRLDLARGEAAVRRPLPG